MWLDGHRVRVFLLSASHQDGDHAGLLKGDSPNDNEPGKFRPEEGMPTATMSRTKKPASPFTPISGEYLKAEIREATFNDKDGKQEMVVTLLREGPGNLYNRNWYTRPALESAKAALEARRKQYFNHAKDTDNPDRDVRDWASSIQEMWIEEDGGKAKLMARVRVFDEWLWDRAKKAPDELAVSMEGKGRGRPEVIEGQRYNAIYEIPVANGVNWVDYPGNAGMGVQVLESQKSAQEEGPMDIKEILEALKGRSESELSELREFLVIPAPGPDAKTVQDLANLKEAVGQIKIAAEGKIKELTDRLTAVEGEKNALASKVEAHEIKEKAMSKERLADSLLASSKLKEEHKTPTFRQTLLGVKEYKDGEKLVSEADQMKALIADREKICVAEVATPPAGGGSPTEVPVEEQSKNFLKNVLGFPGFPETEKKPEAALAA